MLSDGTPTTGHWVLMGDEEINGKTIQLEVLVRPSYPFSPPKVRATDGSGGNSWHQEPDGWLCLWDDSANGPGAWATRAVVIDRVRGWFHEAANGWPDDAPDLDLDRYWSRSDGLVLYGDLPKTGWVRLTQTPAVGRGPVWTVKGNGGSRKRNRAAGYVIDIGEPAHPPRVLFDLLDGVDEDAARVLQQALDDRHVGWIVVRYTRRGNEGVLTLHVTYDGTDPDLTAVASAGSNEQTRNLRAGHEAPQLHASRVAVVGLGGVGSFLADELARSGLRLMTLVDGELLVPGNLVRHLLSDSSVGWNKAAAMKRYLTDVRALDPASVDVYDRRLVDLADAVMLIEQHEVEVVVDATGDVAATAALIAAAEMLDKPLISVAASMGGRVIRVDRFPLLDGEASAEDPQLPPSRYEKLYESGCGGPVSPTPPWAVTLAASHGARAVVAVLTGHQVSPSYVQTIAPDGPAEVVAG